MLGFDSKIVKFSGWISGLAILMPFLDVYDDMVSKKFMFITDLFLSVFMSIFFISISFVFGREMPKNQENFSFGKNNFLGFSFIFLFFLFGCFSLWRCFFYDNSGLYFFIGVQFISISMCIFYFGLCSFLRRGEK